MSTGTTIYDVAARLVTDVSTELSAVGLAVTRAAVYPAMIPWDGCECGTLAVAVQRQYLTTSFPAVADAEQVPCGGGFVAADLLVQLLRCAPTPDGRSVAPGVGPLEDTAKLILTDAWVALSTAQCTLAALEEEGVIVEYVVRPQAFAGPQGGCVGSVLAVTVAVEQSGTLT